MKTTILNLLIALTLLSSCNTAKQYANYRFGGKSEKENNISTASTTETKPEVVVKIIDSIVPENDFKNEKVELPQEEFNSHKTSELTTLKKAELKIDKSFHKIPRAIKILPTINPLTEKDSLKQKRKDSLYYKNSKKEIKASDVLDTFIGILLVASLIFTVVTYLASVNFAIADVILIALAIGLGILLCIGLGKLIMGMFPGMSKKKKSQKKIVSPIKKSKAGFQKYGTDIEDVLYFIIGLLLIAGGIMALLAVGVSVSEIIIFGLGLIGFLILLYFIGEAFMNIFPGMSRKNKKTFSIKTILQKTLPSKSMKNYGGMSIKDYFNIGLLVIIAAGLFTFVFFSLSDAIMLATLLFSIHLVISLMLCIGYGLVYICTGGMMNLKK